MTTEEQLIKAWDDAQRDYLEGMIGMEMCTMLSKAGFRRDDNLLKSLEALGGQQKVFLEARERVLKRLSWTRQEGGQ
jgi:hypothetical protein